MAIVTDMLLTQELLGMDLIADLVSWTLGVLYSKHRPGKLRVRTDLSASMPSAILLVPDNLDFAVHFSFTVVVTAS